MRCGLAACRLRRGWRRVETNVVLRALAIVLITGSHIHLFSVLGGAHVLLGIAGYNFARRLKTLSGLRSYEQIAKIRIPEPVRFIVNPIHQMPALNT